MCQLWSWANYAQMQIRHESRWVWQVNVVVVVIVGLLLLLLFVVFRGNYWRCFTAFKVTRQPGMLPAFVQVNWIIFICHFPFQEAATLTSSTTTTNLIECCQTRVCTLYTGCLSVSQSLSRRWIHSFVTVIQCQHPKQLMGRILHNRNWYRGRCCLPCSTLDSPNKLS